MEILNTQTLFEPQTCNDTTTAKDSLSLSWFFDGQKCEFCANEHCKCNSYMGCDECDEFSEKVDGICTTYYLPDGCLRAVKDEKTKVVTKCTDCTKGYTLVDNSYCIKTDGYGENKGNWGANFLPIDGAYKNTSLITKCLQPGSPLLGNCDSRSFNSSNGQCTQCKKGYFLNPCGQCQLPTIKNCTTVYQEFCLQCDPGFYLSSNMKCAPCIEGCSSCSNGLTCDTCFDTMTYDIAPNDIVLKNQSCLAWKKNSKNTCDCTKCNVGYVMSTNYCAACQFRDDSQASLAKCENSVLNIQGCFTGYSLVNMSATAPSQPLRCVALTPFCFKGKDNLNGSKPICEVCQRGYYLDDAMQCQSCSTNKNLTSLEFVHRCTKTRPLSCKGTRSATFNEESRFDKIGALTSTDYYLQKYKSNGVEYSQCVLNVNKCKKMIEGFDIQTNNLTGKCETCYKNYTLQGDKTCAIETFANCNNTSNDTNICISCMEGYLLQDGKCTKCTDNCLSCDSSNCLKCASGYSYFQNKCIKCRDNCDKCQNSEECLDKGCSPGAFQKGIYCTLCDSSKFCVSCKDENNCQECKKESGYYLATVGLDKDGLPIKQCKQCEKGCNDCYENENLATTNCTLCDSKYMLSNGRCLPRWLMCYTWDNGVCTACAYGAYLFNGKCYKYYDYNTYILGKIDKPNLDNKEGYQPSPWEDEEAENQVDPDAPPNPDPEPQPEPNPTPVVYGAKLSLSLAALIVMILVVA